MRVVAVVAGVVCLIAAVALVFWMNDLGGVEVAGPGGVPASSPKNAEGEFKENPFAKPVKGPFAKLEASEAEYDFGLMKYKTEDSHTFVIRNTGDAVLKLAKGPSTCQCTMSDLSSDVVEVPPGGSHEITVTWKPDFPTEDFSKQASIWTNDPAMWEEGSASKDGKIVFTVKGQVLNSAEVEPSLHSLGTIDETKPTPFSTLIFSRVMKDLEVSIESISSQFVTAQLEPASEEDLKEKKALSGFRLRGELNPKVAIGRVRETIKLKTNDDQNPELEITIEAFRQGPVSIAGRFWNGNYTMVDFARFKAADGIETTLSLYSAKGAEPLELTLAEKRPDFLEVTVARDEAYAEPDRERHTLTVRVPAGRPPERLVSKEAGYVRFTTNHPDVPEIKFYVIYESH